MKTSNRLSAVYAAMDENAVQLRAQTHVPLWWRSEPRVLVEMVNKGRMRMPLATQYLEAAEAKGWIEFRPASLSRPDDRGDLELPVLDEDRGKIRQVRRTLLTRQEEVALNPTPPRVVALEDVAKRERHRQERIRTAPPLWMTDPTRAAVIDLQETVAELNQRMSELELRDRNEVNRGN